MISILLSEKIELDHIVFDYNGTIALDGEPLTEIASKVHELAQKVQLHVLTADTYGTVASKLKDWPVDIHVLEKTSDEDEAACKHSFLQTLGAGRVASIGNGRNDALLLEHSAVGVGICGREGLSVKTMSAADVIVFDILDALDLFLKPERLRATLRN